MAPDTPVGDLPATGGFSRADRILNRPRFLAIYRMSSPIFAARFVFYAAPNGGSNPRLGISVPKKTANSVGRNRIRRLLREAFRRNRAGLPAGCDLVANAKRSAKGSTYAEVEADLLRAIRRLETEGYAPCRPSSSP